MLTLVLGGAASGKSEYAEALVLRSALPRYYLVQMATDSSIKGKPFFR